MKPSSRPFAMRSSITALATPSPPPPSAFVEPAFPAFVAGFLAAVFFSADAVTGALGGRVDAGFLAATAAFATNFPPAAFGAATLGAAALAGADRSAFVELAAFVVVALAVGFVSVGRFRFVVLVATL